MAVNECGKPDFSTAILGLQCLSWCCNSHIMFIINVYESLPKPVLSSVWALDMIQ